MSDPVPTSPACNANAQTCSVVISFPFPSSDKRCPLRCRVWRRGHKAVFFVPLWTLTLTSASSVPDIRKHSGSALCLFFRDSDVCFGMVFRSQRLRSLPMLLPLPLRREARPPLGAEPQCGSLPPGLSGPSSVAAALQPPWGFALAVPSGEQDKACCIWRQAANRLVASLLFFCQFSAFAVILENNSALGDLFFCP